MCLPFGKYVNTSTGWFLRAWEPGGRVPSMRVSSRLSKDLYINRTKCIVEKIIFNSNICMFFLFLSVLARFVLVPKLFCSNSEISRHLFSGFIKKSTRFLLLLQIFEESLRIHLIINIFKFSPKVAVVMNTPPPPLLSKTFQNLHLTPCCFEPFLDQGVSSSLSFPTLSTIRSQCHQVSCTLLFFFQP